ncbi:MAG: hypothetical protein ABF739_00085 [Acetobacter okinawensis]|uniref:hypothetical protein n=1 Tax=Acetobacter okinawensis TaxID=1076594 RepID=UPI0039E7392A
MTDAPHSAMAGQEGAVPPRGHSELTMRTIRLNETTLQTAATLAMLLWSLLARTAPAALAGVCVALWFPASIRVCSVALHWLPVACGMRPRTKDRLTQQHELVAGCLLVAACTLALLLNASPLVALVDAVALNLANLLVQFERREGWLPNALLMPLLLCGLLAGAVLGHAGSAIAGACVGWVLGGLGLFGLSVRLRGNFLSGADMLLLCACGAWVGWGGRWAFMLFAGCVLLGVRAVRGQFHTPFVQAAPLAGARPVWRYPTALPAALGLLLVFLLTSSPALPHWARLLLGG